MLIPSYMRAALRRGLILWSRSGRAPGYLYRTVEEVGATLGSAPLDTRLFTGSVVTCDLSDHIQRHIYFFGAYEPVEAFLFRRLLRPGMVVFDIGANIGQYALIAADGVAPGGAVHAFEPIPKNFEVLKSNVERNGLQGLVTVCPAAVWSRAGEIELSLPADDVVDNGTNYTIAPVRSPADTFRAPAIALDSYVSDRGLERLDVIKIDIEGAELAAMEGAAETIARHRPTILMEINRSHSQALGYDPDQIWSLLEPLGYRIWGVGDSPQSSGPARNLTGIDRMNVFFHVDDLPAEITAGWSLRQVLASHRAGRAAGES